LIICATCAGKFGGNVFVVVSEELTWSGLTTQEILLEKLVKSQGAEISLNELMSAESQAAKFLPLGDLLEEKELQIADPVPVTIGYNKSFYIKRTFRAQREIKQNIFNDKDLRD
jgi:hypothetical protein